MIIPLHIRARIASHSTFLMVTVCVSIVFGVVCILPNIWQRFDHVHPYRGIDIMPTDQEFYYAARVKEVMDGDWHVGNAYRETKDTPALQPALPEWTLAMVGRLCGVDAMTVFIGSKFFFGMLILIILVGFFSSLTFRPWESLLAVTILLFAGTVLGAPWDLMKMMSNMLILDPLRFSRPINPQWIVPWFFGILWLLTLWIRKRRRWHMPLIAFCTSVCLYSYVYAWTYVLTVMGLLLLWCVWKREWFRVRDLSLFFFLFVLLAIPYLVQLHGLIQHPWYAQTAMRQGLVHRRVVILGFWAVTFTPLAVFVGRMHKPMLPLTLSLAVGGIVVLNQQLITGLYLVPHHYHWYFIQPLSSVFLLITLFSVARIFSRQIRIVAAMLLFGLSLSFGTLQQARAYDNAAPQWATMQRYAPVIHYISQSIGQQGNVLYASEQNTLLSDSIVIYTSADVYSGSNANNFLTSDERARTSFFFDLWLRGVTPQEARASFPTSFRSMLSSHLHSIYYREFRDDYAAISDEEVYYNIREYERYFHLPVEHKIHLFPLTHIIFGPADRMTDQWRSLLRLGTPVYDGDGFIIIRLPVQQICPVYTQQK